MIEADLSNVVLFAVLAGLVAGVTGCAAKHEATPEADPVDSARAVGLGDGMFYRPDSVVHGTPESYGLKAEVVWFAATGGPRLHGWWTAADGEPLGTVVYCHGNHANLTHHARFVAWLPSRGFNLLVFDYRGYGQSEGTVSRAGTVEDTLAAIDFALDRDPERTVVFGHSLGGAVGIVAAARRPAVRAVVAESTFPSYRDAARGVAPLLKLMVPLLVSEGLDPIRELADIAPRPLLVIHGTDDAITPFELGQTLFAAASEPKQWYAVQGGGHITPWVHLGREFEVLVCDFLTRGLNAAPPR